MNTCHLLCPSFMIKEPMQFAGAQIMLLSHCYLNYLLHHMQSNLIKITASDRCICAKLQPGAENCMQDARYGSIWRHKFNLFLQFRSSM